MTNEDINNFVKEMAHSIKTGQPTSHGDRVWEVSESDIDTIKAKLLQELYAPKQEVIDFTQWMQDKKGK